MSNFYLIKLTIPATHKDAANRLAAIFDFDLGGGDTFGVCALSPTGAEPATHYLASTAIRPAYLPVLTDPVACLAILSELSAYRGRAAPLQADVDAWCANVLVGEPEGLVRIVPPESGN